MPLGYRTTDHLRFLKTDRCGSRLLGERYRMAVCVYIDIPSGPDVALVEQVRISYRGQNEPRRRTLNDRQDGNRSTIYQ